MSTLNWRTAREVVLHEATPNLPVALWNVEVAVEGSFLHIHQPASIPAGQEYDVHMVPAAAVKTITYRGGTPEASGIPMY